jgi:8-oxo-dGTP pyrophosphatase MutT (NUDIX family)
MTSLILEKLSHHQPRTLNETSQSAAVMIILLVDDADELSIVITKRAASLPTYAGHYSFPGGMRDENDHDLYATAVREIQEELHLLPDSYKYIAQLDDFHDRYGHLVRPYVTIMKKNAFMNQYEISADEIVEVYFFPLSKLNLLLDNPELHAITKRRPSYSFTDGDVFIWGLTASILVHFYNIISGNNP